jgi:hypothetical protein
MISLIGHLSLLVCKISHYIKEIATRSGIESGKSIIHTDRVHCCNSRCTVSITNHICSTIISRMALTRDNSIISTVGKQAFFQAYNEAKPGKPDEPQAIETKPVPATRDVSCPVTRAVIKIVQERRSRSRSGDAWTSRNTKSDSDLVCSLKKDHRRRRRYSFHRKSFTESISLDLNEQTDALAKELLDENGRYELIDSLLADHADQGHLKVRFVVAVNDFEQTTDKKLKTLKGVKIVSIFVDPKSHFHLKGVPPEYEGDLVGRARLSSLKYLKQHVLESLLLEPATQRFMKVRCDDSSYSSQVTMSPTSC